MVLCHKIIYEKVSISYTILYLLSKFINVYKNVIQILLYVKIFCIVYTIVEIVGNLYKITPSPEECKTFFQRDIFLRLIASYFGKQMSAEIYSLHQISEDTYVTRK